MIEAELDKRGKLDALHRSVEARAAKPWADIQKNLSFYRTHLYAAACEVAGDVFGSSKDVDQALKEAERGEIHNVSFLIDTILADLQQRETTTKRSDGNDQASAWFEGVNFFDDSGQAGNHPLVARLWARCVRHKFLMPFSEQSLQDLLGKAIFASAFHSNTRGTPVTPPSTTSGSRVGTHAMD